ncbi:hypothetical protein [Paenibacillus polymyxa]|uniref:hypothetical protein n=1 Tax=Paenibacillus polymyxa TaxID=1406 RepID=UPI00177EC59A|nr:hypothetical protein [Paenibacillus polymyxa]MDU8674257.1 hypothetical protein [Paenibacillus polymyxa]MDU8699165.1 hypothetical protein [Paenibacillus polymyxa]QOH60359.1 hypothetical protein DI243_02580 [Paenibacillus polymyxa]URJ53837.1 hypothetical protein MF623_003149 [Paenibacillus polymyxa]URJ65684.1 hypothetical protein MF620_000495 [Paenibacillus polymyxa]
MGTDNEQQDALLQREIEIVEGILESKAQYRKIVKAGIAQWVNDLQAGNIKMQTVQDLDRLIELDIKLQKDEL